MSDPAIPPPTPKSNSERLDIIEAGERFGVAVLSKTAVWAISIAVCIFSAAGAVGLVSYFAGDKLLKWQEVSLQVESIRQNHEHCIMEVSALRERVAKLESKATAQN